MPTGLVAAGCGKRGDHRLNANMPSVRGAGAALPNVVCDELAARNDLGIHSEVLCPGMIDLKGKSSTERAHALIELAHSAARRVRLPR